MHILVGLVFGFGWTLAIGEFSRGWGIVSGVIAFGLSWLCRGRKHVGRALIVSVIVGLMVMGGSDRALGMATASLCFVIWMSSTDDRLPPIPL